MTKTVNPLDYRTKLKHAKSKTLITFVTNNLTIYFQICFVCLGLNGNDIKAILFNLSPRLTNNYL